MIAPERTPTHASRGLAVAVVVLSFVTAALVPLRAAGAAPASLRMASKNFAGAQALTQAYGQALAGTGAHVTFQEDVGATEQVFPMLQDGTIDAYAEYQGTLLTYLGGKPTADPGATHAALEKRLEGTGVVVSKPAPAVDVNGFYVTRKTAARYHLTKVSDLAKVAPRLTIGGPPECPTRPLCLGDKSQRAYGLHFAAVVGIDPSTAATRQALVHGDIDVAVLFTGSSVIPRNAVLLRDDKGLQPADNPVLLIRQETATPETLRVIDAVSAKITTAAYNRMAFALSSGHQDPTQVAAQFLSDNQLP
jgi:osmoprotectant transport system substrate-binding protein